MRVKLIKVGKLRTNCYILTEGNNCVVIDPGDDFPNIRSQIGPNRLLAILLTHRHDDHVGALRDLVKYYGVPVYDRYNLEERRYDFGGIKIEVIYTPGHSADSVSYLIYEYGFMFDGDFIFRGTIGRCDLPTGNMDEMTESLKKMAKYSERTILYPGHEASTTLGEEYRNNPFLKDLK